MGLGGAGGPHLVEVDLAAEASGLEGGFRACQASADHLDSLCCHVLPFPYELRQSLRIKRLRSGSHAQGPDFIRACPAKYSIHVT